MNNITLFSLIAVAFVAVGTLFVINFTTYIPFGQTSVYLAKDAIRGMAVAHNNKLFTLNYDQQTQLVDFINQSVSAKEDKPVERTVDVQKIVIYQFENKPDREIVSLGYDTSDNLIFLYGQKRMKDKSDGKLKQLLSETYDH